MEIFPEDAFETVKATYYLGLHKWISTSRLEYGSIRVKTSRPVLAEVKTLHYIY